MSDEVTVLPSSVASPPPKQTTADDLLDMYAQEPVDEQAEVAAEVTKQAKVAEALPKKILSNNLAKKINEKAISKTADSVQKTEEAGDAETEADETTDDGELSKPDGLSRRSLKAKSGDAELDIPEDAEMMQTVNGKDVPVKIKEAVKVYAELEDRTRKLDQRWSYVDRREKEMRGEYETIQSKFKTISELAEQGDHNAAIRVMAEMAGKDPVEYEKHVLENLEKMVNTFSKMSPLEKEKFFLERKANYLQKKHDEVQTKATFEGQKQALHGKIKELCAENKLSVDDFATVWKKGAEAKIWADPNTVTPEQVIEFHQDMQHMGKVHQALNKIDPTLWDNREFSDEVAKLTRSHPEYTIDDIMAIVKDAIGVDSQSIESLNRKVQKANATGHRAQSTQVGSKKETKSEIDEELEEFFLKRRPIVVR